MVLSFRDNVSTSRERLTVEAEIITEDPWDGEEMPIIVLEDGDTLDKSTWLDMECQVEEATEYEEEKLEKMGLI